MEANNLGTGIRKMKKDGNKLVVWWLYSTTQWFFAGGIVHRCSGYHI
jgi:hypothetical protein